MTDPSSMPNRSSGLAVPLLHDAFPQSAHFTKKNVVFFCILIGVGCTVCLDPSKVLKNTITMAWQSMHSVQASAPVIKLGQFKYLSNNPKHSHLLLSPRANLRPHALLTTYLEPTRDYPAWDGYQQFRRVTTHGRQRQIAALAMPDSNFAPRNRSAVNANLDALDAILDTKDDGGVAASFNEFISKRVTTLPPGVVRVTTVRATTLPPGVVPMEQGLRADGRMSYLPMSQKEARKKQVIVCNKAAQAIESARSSMEDADALKSSSKIIRDLAEENKILSDLLLDSGWDKGAGEGKFAEWLRSDLSKLLSDLKIKDDLYDTYEEKVFDTRTIAVSWILIILIVAADLLKLLLDNISAPSN